MAQHAFNTFHTNGLVLLQHLLDSLRDFPVVHSWLDETDGDLSSLVGSGNERRADVGDGRRGTDDDGLGADDGVSINVSSHHNLDKVVFSKDVRGGIGVGAERREMLQDRVDGKGSGESDSCRRKQRASVAAIPTQSCCWSSQHCCCLNRIAVASQPIHKGRYEEKKRKKVDRIFTWAMQLGGRVHGAAGTVHVPLGMPLTLL